jgi:urease accessory protein
MLVATGIARKGSYGPEMVRDRIVLDFDRRNRRRILLRTATDQEILLDLAEMPRLRNGDALVLRDRSVVVVSAQNEALLEICGEDKELIRIAWHLGNRHVPVQLVDSGLLTRDDHVIAEMVRGLGGQVRSLMAPFDPEGGAYQTETHGNHSNPFDDAGGP